MGQGSARGGWAWLARLAATAGSGLLALPASAQLTIDWPHCNPSNDLDLNPGGSISCATGPGVSLPLFDIILEIIDGEQVEVSTTTPLTNVTATINAGAVISGNPDGIFAPESGATLVNNGSINATGEGLSAAASGATVTNNGHITATGDPTGSEGIGIFGSGAVATNAFGASITVDGPFAEAIGIEGANGQIINAGDIAVGGTEAGGLGIEGDNATIENQLGGTITLVDAQQTAAISTSGTGADITNAGNVLMNGIANIGIGAFGSGQSIMQTGSVFGDGSPASLGIGIAGPGGSLTLGNGSNVDTASGSINVVLAGSAAFGTNSLAEFGIGSGVTFTASSNAALNVGENSVGLLIAHDEVTLPAMPAISSSAFGAVGAALYGVNLTADVTGFATLLGESSTLIGVGSQGNAAPGFVVTGGSATNATVNFAQPVSMTGENSTILDAAGDDHTITVQAGGDLTTPLSGSAIKVVGDRADVDVEAMGLITGGGIAVMGDHATITNRGNLLDKGISVQTGIIGGATIENFGIIDLHAIADSIGIALLSGTGDSQLAVGSATETGLVAGEQAAYGIDVATVGGNVMLTVGETSEINVPAGAVARAFGTLDISTITVEALGVLTGNSGLSVRGGTANVTTAKSLTIVENERWLEGTTDTGLAVETEAATTAWTADDSISVTSNVAVTDADRFAVSLTGEDGNRATSITVDYSVVFSAATLSVDGARLSGINLEADSVTGDLLLDEFTVNATGPGFVYGIKADILNEFDLRVGSLVVPMTWAVLGESQTIGYQVNADFGDPLMKVVNAGNLGVGSPVQPIGMALEAANPLTAPPPGAGAITIPVKRELSNEGGTIELAGGSNAVGMLVGDDANDVRIENGGTIRTVGPSPGARGIRIDNVERAFAINAGVIDIADGDGARGIELMGTRSVVVNGNADAVTVPVNGQLLNPDGTYPAQSSVVLSVAFDFSTSETASFPLPGEITLNGANTVGIDVGGSDNFVATFLGNPEPPVTGPESSITVTGANSIGVRLTGTGNTLYNDSQISGGAFAVHGGAGNEVVVNAGILSGRVALEGGDDIYAFIAGAVQGIVDAGSQTGVDTLYTIAGSQDGSAASTIAVDFTLFSAFEVFEKSGPERLIVQGELDVPDSNVRQGVLEIALGATVTGDVSCGPGTGLAGDGLILGDVIGILCDVELGASDEASGTQLVGPDELGTQSVGVNAGTPGGALQIDGDVSLQGGTVRVDIGSTTEFDQLDVGGNLAFDGTVIEFNFVGGFVPGPEDTFDVFQAGGAITGTETVTFSFAGVTGTAAFVDLGGGSLGVVFDVRAPTAVPVLGTWFSLLLAAALLALGIERSFPPNEM